MVKTGVDGAALEALMEGAQTEYSPGSMMMTLMLMMQTYQT